MSTCYVCTAPTSTKLNEIPFCADCLPRDPRARTPRFSDVRIEPLPMHVCTGYRRPPGELKWCSGDCPVHACRSADACEC